MKLLFENWNSYLEEDADPCWDGYRKAGMKKKGDKMVPNCVPLEEDTLEEKKKKKKKKKKAKRDACYHKVRSRYKVWPSAYASGALVKCRKVGAKNWGNKSKKNEQMDLAALLQEITQEDVELTLEEVDLTDEEVAELRKIKKELEGASKMHKGQADRIGDVMKEEKMNCGCGQDPCKTYGVTEAKKKKAGTESSKESNLRDWFKRKGAKGSKSGWVDCNAPDGKGGYKACGRESGEKRSKYPACRPTPGACKERGKGKSWGKKAKKEAIEMRSDELYGLISEEVNRFFLETDVLPYLTEAFLDDGTPVCVGCLAEQLDTAACGCPDLVYEAEYRGRKVKLNKPMRGDVKKFKVYVKDPKTGNVKKVNFGDKKMRIKKSNPKRRKSFRARHNCDNPGPKTKARYWSCKKW